MTTLPNPVTLTTEQIGWLNATCFPVEPPKSAAPKPTTRPRQPATAAPRPEMPEELARQAALVKVEALSDPRRRAMNEALATDNRPLWEQYLREAGRDHTRNGAHLSMCDHLALAAIRLGMAPTPELVEAAFNLTKLAEHDKWVDRPKYRRTTINKAIAFALEHAASRPGAGGASVATAAASAKAAGELVTRNLATIHAEPIRWLVRNFLPAGMLVLFYGPGGLGKSFLTLHVAAALSRGRMPFGFDLPNPAKGKTLLVGCEDDIARIVIPRLIALGADLTQIEIVDSVKRVGDGDTIEFDLTHVEELRRRLEADPAIRLVVIDPVSSFVSRSKRDEHKAGEVRSLLDPLAKLAADTGACVLLVSHVNKNCKASAVDRASGSGAFTTGVRAAYMFAPDPAAADTRVLVPTKANVLPRSNRGVRFRLDGIGNSEAMQLLDAAGQLLDKDGRDRTPEDLAELLGQMFRPAWLGEAAIDPDSLNQPKPQDKGPSKVDRAVEVLVGKLGGFAWPVSEVDAAVEAAGVSGASLRKAKERLEALPLESPLHLSREQRCLGKSRSWWLWLGEQKPADRPATS